MVLNNFNLEDDNDGACGCCDDDCECGDCEECESEDDLAVADEEEVDSSMYGKVVSDDDGDDDYRDDR